MFLVCYWIKNTRCTTIELCVSDKGTPNGELLIFISRACLSQNQYLFTRMNYTGYILDYQEMDNIYYNKTLSGKN